MSIIGVSRRRTSIVGALVLGGLAAATVWSPTGAQAQSGDKVAGVVVSGAGYTQTVQRSDGPVTLSYTLTDAGADRTLRQAATPTALPSGRDPNNAVTFSPSDVASTSAAQVDATTRTGCAATSATERTDCGVVGSVTVTFSRPVTNPTLHVAGLGAHAIADTNLYAPYLRVTGSQSATGVADTAAFGAVLGAPTNLQTSGGQLRTATVRPGAQCSGTQVATSDGPAGCGSVLVTGTGLTSVTFAVGTYSSGAAVSPGTVLQSEFTVDVSVPDVQPVGTAFGCTTNNVYGLDVEARDISRIDVNTGALTPAGHFDSPAGRNLNGLALSYGGTAAYAITQAPTGGGQTIVYRYDPVTDTTTSYAGPTVDGSASIVAGAIDPSSGIYYVAYKAVGSLAVYGFDTATNTAIIGRVATIGGLSSRANTNGDLAFSRQGYPVFVDSTGDGSATANPLLYVQGTLPRSGVDQQLTGTLVGYLQPDTATFNGIAFDGSAGNLYVNRTVQGTGTANVLAQVDPRSGAVIAAHDESSGGQPVAGIGDLATCQYDNTIVQPGVAIAKTGTLTDIDGSGSATPGDRIQWGLTVTNTGDTELTDIAVSDPRAGDATCAATTLAAGASTTCTVADTTLSQEQIDSGSFENTATVTGTGNNTTVTDTGTATVPLPARPGLSLVKRGVVTDTNGNDSSDAGDSVQWSLVVTNTGNVTVTTVAIDDPSGGPVTCEATTLAPGEQTTCLTEPHVLTQAEIEQGSLSNTASVTGTTPDGGSVPPVTATATVTFTDRLVSVPVTSGGGTGGTGSGPGTTPTGPSAGPTLASTGVPALPLLLGGAALLFLLGAACLLAGRRRTESDGGTLTGDSMTASGRPAAAVAGVLSTVRAWCRALAEALDQPTVVGAVGQADLSLADVWQARLAVAARAP